MADSEGHTALDDVLLWKKHENPANMHNIIQLLQSYGAIATEGNASLESIPMATTIASRAFAFFNRHEKKSKQPRRPPPQQQQQLDHHTMAQVLLTPLPRNDLPEKVLFVSVLNVWAHHHI
jgi:hypothetical protein